MCRDVCGGVGAMRLSLYPERGDALQLHRGGGAGEGAGREILLLLADRYLDLLHIKYDIE